MGINKVGAVLATALLFAGLVVPTPADAVGTPPACRDWGPAWDSKVNDYYNPYQDLELHGLQRCAAFGSAGGFGFQFWLLELTDPLINQAYPPGGVFFLWAPETNQYGDQGFWWIDRTATTTTEARKVQFDERCPCAWGAPAINWHHRLDVRYGTYNQPSQATVVAYLVDPRAVGR